VTETPEQSDQLPEEGPAEYLPDDTGRPSAAEEAGGRPDDEGTATGNPNAAGAEGQDRPDPDEDEEAAADE
jgi:hypothetical protein